LKNGMNRTLYILVYAVLGILGLIFTLQRIAGGAYLSAMVPGLVVALAVYRLTTVRRWPK
jgi:uncharacterized protein YaaW (UPF0174 family)